MALPDAASACSQRCTRPTSSSCTASSIDGPAQQVDDRLRVAWRSRCASSRRARRWPSARRAPASGSAGLGRPSLRASLAPATSRRRRRCRPSRLQRQQRVGRASAARSRPPAGARRRASRACRCSTASATSMAWTVARGRHPGNARTPPSREGLPEGAAARTCARAPWRRPRPCPSTWRRSSPGRSRRPAPTASPGADWTAAAARRCASMKASTPSRAFSSWCCTGGDFMRYADGNSSAPPMPWSRASLARRTASMTMPAEFGESHTSSLSSATSGTSPKERPSRRMYAHLRSVSHGTWSDGPMWTLSAPRS